jgi:hypothetical protein
LGYQVSNQITNDRSERGTNDDTNGHIHDIAFVNEVFESLKHLSVPHTIL